MAARCDIVGGPGEYNWKTTFGSKTLRDVEPITFEVKPRTEELEYFQANYALSGYTPRNRVFRLPVKINLDEWRDNGGHNWNFRGWCGGSSIWGAYSTETRTGWIVFETPEEVERREFVQAAMRLGSLFAARDPENTRHTSELLDNTLWALNWPKAEFEKALHDGLI